ncbi:MULTISPECIES: diacylglycerol kinase [Thermoactinomyces]|jgi:diacylglycerol kinase (ATP)|uniref:Diacylglycerol kinase family protein n=1 Tax=Thermoactinomyces vulgaris TaxID=2026 RepID=A0ABS0QHE1_THEVU|nr:MULTISPECIES: diacylglycerol kinase family protein [Thermoactinomyces]MBA4550617.1 diacylglycerol kinase family protein [Thermoactinomyces vulgaris]MBA4596324.1 diacylglycerol kinase family protein [Thermoactinomyces vulgaris]MBH8582945.1 diacylglycerol kinase family protein [Thermoactinomyces sp. CICC 10735]MBH8585735.1 diacylglycerol kinase family protein [Thermoactinomyces sp. CICC 10520]MBH8588393.1 diacylglycerol kinase family protein [Thermoactinomyces vulgaris]
MKVTKLLRSFVYALEGLKYTIVTQRNMRFHFLVALGVLLLSLTLPMNKVEVLVLFVAIVLVLFAELINTAIEAVVDMVTGEYHPLAKVAKDVAAGAVLLTAGFAVIIGISVFYPHLDALFTLAINQKTIPANISLAIIIVFDFFLTLFIKGWLQRMDRGSWEPSMVASIAGCVSVLLIGVIGHFLITLLVLVLFAMLIGTRLRFRSSRKPVFFGVCLGILVALIGAQFL